MLQTTGFIDRLQIKVIKVYMEKKEKWASY